MFTRHEFDRLTNACIGKTLLEGGMNRIEMISIGKRMSLPIETKMTRDEVQEIISKNLDLYEKHIHEVEESSFAAEPAAAIVTAKAISTAITLMKKEHIINTSCDELLIFRQVSTICWLHSAVHVLFFADRIRDVTWTYLFDLLPVGKYYIPVRLRDISVKVLNPSTLILVELLRKQLEITAEVWADVISKHDTVIPILSSKRVAPMLSRQASSDRCDMILQHTICKMLPSFCGAVGGFQSDVIIGINDLLRDITGTQPFILVNTAAYTGSLNFADAFMATIRFETSVHGISIIKCNGTWILFDNDMDVIKRYISLTLSDTFKIADLILEIEKIYGKFPVTKLFAVVARKLPNLSELSMISHRPPASKRLDNFMSALGPNKKEIERTLADLPIVRIEISH